MIWQWTKVGEVYTREAREELSSIFSRMKWRHLRGELPAFEALAINDLVRGFRIPAVRMAASNDLAPFGLYGIEGRYKNGTVRIFFLDDGTHLVPIASGLIERRGQ